MFCNKTNLFIFISSFFHVNFFLHFTLQNISLFLYSYTTTTTTTTQNYFSSMLLSSQFHLPSGNRQLSLTSANLIEYAHKAMPHAFLPRAIRKNPPSPHPEFQLHIKNWIATNLDSTNTTQFRLDYRSFCTYLFLTIQYGNFSPSTTSTP